MVRLRYDHTAPGTESVPSRRAVNDLRLLSPREAWHRFHEFEFWSQLVLKEFFPEHRVPTTTVVRPRRRTARGDVVLVTGEIGTGKTTFADLLCDRMGFASVSTRSCVARLMGEPDFGQGDRARFQQRAAELVSREEGVGRLADEIAAAVGRLPRPVVIDGVRHRQTVEALRQKYSNLVVMFIDCSRDDAFRNFRSVTDRNALLSEFRDARAHRVEADVASLKHDADAYIFNGAIQERCSTYSNPGGNGARNRRA